MPKRRHDLAKTALFLLITALSTPAFAQAYAGGADDLSMMGMGEMPSVAKMSDSDATCEQLFAESEHLEQEVAALPKGEDPMALSQKMTDDIMASQRKAMQSARAKGMASSLLGMVPGVGGLAAQALSPGMGAMGDTSEQMQKHMKALQDSTAANMAIYHRQARQQHLTDLFLDRGCKVSQLQAGALSNARAQWTPEAVPAATAASASPAAAEAPAPAAPPEAAATP